MLALHFKSNSETTFQTNPHRFSS